MKKIKKTFYLSEEIVDLLRKYSYENRKPMSQLVEEGIRKLLSMERQPGL